MRLETKDDTRMANSWNIEHLQKYQSRANKVSGGTSTKGSPHQEDRT
jgi:hypothetical protein